MVSHSILHVFKLVNSTPIEKLFNYEVGNISLVNDIRLEEWLVGLLSQDQQHMRRKMNCGYRFTKGIVLMVMTSIENQELQSDITKCRSFSTFLTNA